VLTPAEAEQASVPTQASPLTHSACVPQPLSDATASYPLCEPYRRYVLAIITLIYTLNYLDRGLIILLLQPIKDDLHLSDTQLGFLTGISFGLFYATIGLPIARWADRGNRVTISSIALALWGVTVMTCLCVTNFIQMVAARAAAAVGEAGCMPPTYSLVGHYFPRPAERTRAISLYMLGQPLASLAGFVLGGWLSSRYGWRMTFFLMGIPALLIAAIAKLTIREPRVAAGVIPPAPIPPLSEVVTIMWQQPSLRHLTVGIILLYTMWLGQAPWYAAFLMRSHSMGTSEVGTWLGLIFGIGGVAGIAAGGHICAKWLTGHEPRQMRLSALTTAFLVPCFVAFLLLPNKLGALSSMVPLALVGNFLFGPTFALMQRLVTDQMRATLLALVMLLANLIGMGIGPQVVGILSDALMPLTGRDSLRYAMLTTSLLALWAAYHFWQIGHTVGRDLSPRCGGEPSTTTRPPAHWSGLAE
jgi:MFS family permease